MTLTQQPRISTFGHRSIAAPAFLAVAGSGYVLLVGWAMSSTSFDVWGGLLVAPVLVALTVPLAQRVARREQSSGMATFLIAALVLKLAASLVRYAVAFQVYDGVADADTYHDAGVKYAPLFRIGVFDFGKDRIIGTGFTKILTGAVYAVIGPTRIGGFLIFSWLGFWGLYFFYRAFRIGMPHCDHRRYARLVFLLPSMLFWPSSIGKEAWMMFTIGLGCLGAAKLFASQRGGYALLILGGTGTAMVRPHITLILVASVAAGMIVRRNASPRSFGPLATGLAVLALAAASLVAVAQVERFFHLEKLDATSVQQVLNHTSGQTSQGGSTFRSPSPGSVLQLPNSLVTIIFRPFPWEAHNVQVLAASFEGGLLMFVIWRGRRRLLSIRHEVVKSSYAMFASAYVLLFAFAFASINNFGILTRQRVQMFPLLLVLLALPQKDRKTLPPSTPRDFELMRA